MGFQTITYQKAKKQYGFMLFPTGPVFGLAELVSEQQDAWAIPS